MLRASYQGTLHLTPRCGGDVGPIQADEPMLSRSRLWPHISELARGVAPWPGGAPPDPATRRIRADTSPPGDGCVASGAWPCRSGSTGTGHQPDDWGRDRPANNRGRPPSARPGASPREQG
ncbi:MAG: hypothetical protein AVDCRST_MAG49-3138 [uncultured Thermomicrobiales bacterium]|uniref:Uncharacterized protein n=1 Tax=uncultured Thermomicrobiales bacterium TaxID=1645740 RepID=A0A6J4V2S2_9BACT|nr:MAG: hypothetical protein AVDCRST_MAG49-3138 [uncultured Thermomicrobiales bacterium]